MTPNNITQLFPHLQHGVRPLSDIRSLTGDVEAAERVDLHLTFAEALQRNDYERPEHTLSLTAALTIMFIAGMVLAWAALMIGAWLVGVFS